MLSEHVPHDSITVTAIVTSHLIERQYDFGEELRALYSYYDFKSQADLCNYIARRVLDSISLSDKRGWKQLEQYDTDDFVKIVQGMTSFAVCYFYSRATSSEHA